MRLRYAAAVCIGIGSAASVIPAAGRQASPDAPAVLLNLGAPIEREISGAASHAYQLSVAPGEVARLVVEQRGIDVFIELVAPDGARIARIDDEYRVKGATESLDVLGGPASTQIVKIHASRPRSSAGSYRIAVEASRAALERDRSLFEIQKLRTQATQLLAAHRPAEAVPISQRALAIAERVLDPNDAVLGLLVLEAGFSSDEALDSATAVRHYSRAVELLSAAWGPDHPQTLRAKSELGQSHVDTGNLAAAESLLVDTLRREEEALGPDHPLVGMTAMRLARYSQQRGDFASAERGLQRAAAIAEKWFGPDDPRFATVATNLGSLYLDQRDYARAEPHLTRALAIKEKTLGPDHPELATAVQNLGMIAREKKDYAAAEGYYLRALAMREKSVGLDHLTVAGTLNNLANVYGAQGDYAKSLAMHQRALGIFEKHANPWSPPILSLGNIARTYAALGDYANALKFQQRVDAALDADMALNLAIGSERQKLAYLSTIAERTERTLSFHLRLQPDNREAARLAVGTLLQRKGRVLDVMTNTLAVRRAHAGPEEQQLLDRLAETTTRFARLALTGPGKTARQEHVRQLQELQDTKDQLEADISRRSDEARAALQRVTPEAVLQAIPDGVTLIEFAVYRPFDSRATSMTVAYGAPRYAAYVVRGQEVSGLDLGEAKTIDALVESYRVALQDPSRADVKQLARKLDERIMQPLRSNVTDGSRLLISPDGPLALVPFEALVDEAGRYLVEQHPVTYVSTGRDLLRMQVARSSRGAPVVLADPLFGEPETTSNAPAQRAPSPGRRGITAGEDLSAMYFAPLAGTRYEAQSIQSVFPDAQLLSGARATEAALKSVQAPRILHVATHGFFIERAGSAENPLLRSGLALAGANLSKKEDGILTAMEAAHLNLWGTKLVTLSACDTGVGVVRNGDGVYGLRRSIFLAGAETLLMSLWPVSDAITREMMTDYYKGLKAGRGRGDALRRVQLTMLARKERAHPFYWASFIQAGEWANLDGKR